MDRDSRQLVQACVLAAAVALVAALGSLLYTERALVKLSIPPQRLETAATISGGLTGYELATSRLGASVTESRKTATNPVATPASSAAGQAVFICSPQCTAGYSVPAGTVVATANGIQYQTQAAATIPPNDPAPPVAVRAAVAGASGNTPAESVTVVVSHLPSYVHVTNPSSITGGADARPASVVEQSDYDAAYQAVTAKVAGELADDLHAQAQGLTYVTSGPPTMRVTSDFNVGDKTPAFTITAVGDLEAIGYSDAQAQALLISALKQKVPAGYQFTSDAIRATYHTETADPPSGRLTISGSAAGFVIPTVRPSELRALLRGMPIGEALRRLHSTVPSSSADIRVTPVPVPWMPMLTDHIALDVVFEPAPDY